MSAKGLMCAAIVVAVLELLEGVNQLHTGSVVLRNFHIFRFCGESRGKVENGHTKNPFLFSKIKTSSKLCDLLAQETSEITFLHCSQSKRVRLSLGDIKTLGPLAFIKSLEKDDNK